VTGNEGRPASEHATLRGAAWLAREEVIGMLSKYYYVQFAEVFRAVFRRLRDEKVENTYPAKYTLRLMMELFQKDNPRFSREKFITYIKDGLEGDKNGVAVLPLFMVDNSVSAL
jgi:hypothetical protein